MKTRRITFKAGSLLAMVITAALALTIMGCTKEDPIAPGESLATEATYSGNIMTETFLVDPEGTIVNLFDGDVSLEFPEGTVAEPTEFTLASFPLHHLQDLTDLQDHNHFNRGYSLMNGAFNQKFMNSVRIRLKFDLDPEEWLKGAPAEPENITILYVSPTLYAYDRVVCIGGCTTDFSNNMVKGCICQCGFYVVGEN